MAVAIPLEKIREALRAEVGAQLAESELSLHCAEILRRYRRGDNLAQLTEQVRRQLFMDLYGVLGPDMTYRRADGRRRRILLETLPCLADTLVDVLLESLGTSAFPKEDMMCHAMAESSLSAMHALLTRYDVSEGERHLLERILRENGG